MPDAIVIGAGPNGLVAANLLADRGWDVLVCEAAPTAGGAVRSAELIEPGFVNDVFSAFYPLAAASPVIKRLDLEQYGLRWSRAHGLWLAASAGSSRRLVVPLLPKPLRLTQRVPLRVLTAFAKL